MFVYKTSFNYKLTVIIFISKGKGWDCSNKIIRKSVSVIVKIWFFFSNAACVLIQHSAMLHWHCNSLIRRHRNRHSDIVTFTKKSIPIKILINRAVVSGRGADAVDKAPVRGWGREVPWFNVLWTYKAFLDLTALYRITLLRCDWWTCRLHDSFAALKI